MRFAIKTSPQHTEWPDILEVWKAADRMDFWESGWLFDHFYPIFSDSTGPCLEGWTALAALAQATERMRVGVLVTGNVYRHPAVLANMAATVDIVSNGRLELGLGAGWNEEECAAYGIDLPPLKERFDRFDEALEVVVGLLTNTTTDFAGRHYVLQGARCEPKPVQERMPLWIGGSGEKRTLRIVAEHATGWNTFHGDPAEYRHTLDVLERHCEAVGRDPGEIRKQIVARGPLTSDEEAQRLAEAMLPHKAMGVEDFLISARPPADRRTIELFARVVGPAVRGA